MSFPIISVCISSPSVSTLSFSSIGSTMPGSRAYTAMALLAFIALVAGKRPDACPALIAGREWEPLRIKVLLGATDAITPDQSAMLTTELLPRAVAFWERSMRIRRTGSRFRDHRLISPTCGHTLLSKTLLDSLDGFTSVRRGCLGCPAVLTEAGGRPGGRPGVDFVLIVSATRPHKGHELAYSYAKVCARDECGRPTIGYMNMNALSFGGSLDTDALIAVVIHEMSHTLGFVGTFTDWRLPDGSRRIQNPKTVEYYVRKDDRGRILRAGFGWSWRRYAENHLYTYPAGIVESIATRGFGAGSTCRCPIDPTRTYTDEDLTDCLRNPGNCAFAITTPKVKAAAREFFDCDELEGMELENQFGGVWSQMFNPHWKTRLLVGEIMTPAVSQPLRHISPMTFAFFEDSGWYQMDYAMTSTPIRGATWGFKEGCAFVQQKCVNDETGELQRPPMFPNAFCAISGFRCSSDGRGTGRCSVDDDPVLSSPLLQYRYNTSVEQVGYRSNDFCPIYETLAIYWMPYPAARCFMEALPPQSATINGVSDLSVVSARAFIASVRCLGGGDSGHQSYEVSTTEVGAFLGVCVEDGQGITFLPDATVNVTAVLTCSSPALICAQFRFPHLPATSKANRNLDGIGQPDLPLEGIPFELNISPLPIKPHRRRWRKLEGPTPSLVR